MPFGMVCNFSSNGSLWTFFSITPDFLLRSRKINAYNYFYQSIRYENRPHSKKSQENVIGVRLNAQRKTRSRWKEAA